MGVLQVFSTVDQQLLQSISGSYHKNSAMTAPLVSISTRKTSKEETRDDVDRQFIVVYETKKE